MKRYYRVVKTNSVYFPYRVEYRYFRFQRWESCRDDGGVATFERLEEAELFAVKHSSSPDRTFPKYLGRL